MVFFPKPGALILGIWGLCLTAWAQGEVRFHTYSDLHGLSQNQVTALLQDRQGFIWAGTRNGLNRFDGYQFKVFRHDPSDPGSLRSSNIGALYEDRYGYIWVGVKGALHRYDPRLEKFELLPFPGGDAEGNGIILLFEDSTGTLWVSTSTHFGRVSHYDPQNPQSTSYELPSHIPGLGEEGFMPITAITAGPQASFWAGTPKGLYLLKQDLSQASCLFPHPHFSFDYLQGFNGYHITTLLAHPDGTLWIGALGGLFRLHGRKNEGAFRVDSLVHLLHESHSDREVNANSVSDILLDSSGVMWIGTFRKGLFRLNPTSGKSEQFLYQPQQPFGFPSSLQNVSCLLSGRQEMIWMGSNAGISLIPQKPPRFKRFLHLPDNPGSLLTKDCYAYCKDQAGNLWVANRTGITRIDSSRQVYTHFDLEKLGGYEWILDLECGRDGFIWALAKGGLLQLDPEKGLVAHFQANGNFRSLPSTLDVTDLLATRDERLWIAGYRGLVGFDPSSKSFSTYTWSDRNYVNAITEDPKGGLWIGHSLGLSRLHPGRDTFETFVPFDIGQPSPNGKSVRDLLFDPAGILWVGTVEGLFRVDAEGENIRAFGEKEGLPANYIRSLENGHDEELWVATDKGLVILDTRDFTIEPVEVYEGPELRYYSRSSYKSPDGTLYFGGSNGFIEILPGELPKDTALPPVVLTDFRLFYDPAPVGMPAEGPSPTGFFLPRAVSMCDEISLSYRERVFSLHFTSLNYFHPEKNRFAYMLEGFDDHWIETDANQRQATYTNLDPGTYTFRVKASNHDGVWNEAGASLRIHIAPPWWRSWWAYLLYGTLVTSVISLVFYLRIRSISREYETQARIERAKEEEREAVRKRSSRDFHDEAGNKLTKLSLYSELIRRKAGGDPEVAGYLEKMESNLKELSMGMRDFIWVLDPEKDTLVDTLLRLKEFGNSLFEPAGISFFYEAGHASLETIGLDIKGKRHLLLIFKEAMNNCLKYAGASEVYFFAGLEGQVFKITLQDNGKGFDPATVRQGNGLHNMRSRAEEIGGMLEVTTAPGQGTAWTFRKPF